MWPIGCWKVSLGWIPGRDRLTVRGVHGISRFVGGEDPGHCRNCGWPQRLWIRCPATPSSNCSTTERESSSLTHCWSGLGYSGQPRFHLLSVAADPTATAVKGSTTTRGNQWPGFSRTGIMGRATPGGWEAVNQAHHHKRKYHGEHCHSDTASEKADSSPNRGSDN